MKNFKFKWLLLSIVLSIASINTAWAWSGLHVRSGSYYGGWDYTAEQMTFGDEANKYWDLAHTGGTFYWRLRTDYFNHDVGPYKNNQVMNVGTTGYKVVNTGTNAFATTANAGIIRIQTSQNHDGASDEYPNVWVTRPTVKFKYDFNNDGEASWEMVDATDNNDGTYTYKGLYCGTDFFCAGPNDGDKKAHESGPTTITGSPSAGDRCEFKWNCSGYKYVGNEDQNCGMFYITKLLTITYDANGATKGSVPSAQEVLYNTSSTLSTNSGNLEKVGYKFIGWNTNPAGGVGTRYAAGGSITRTSNITLYAEWEAADTWYLKGGNSDKEEDDDDALGDWKTKNYFSFSSEHAFAWSVTLAANTTYQFKLCKNNNGTETWYGNTGTIDATTPAETLNDGDWTFSSSVESNCKLNTGASGAGTYVFTIDGTTDGWPRLRVYFPGDVPKVFFKKKQYIYLKNDVSTHEWYGGDYVARFWFKATTEDVHVSGIDCENSNDLGVSYIYYAQVPDNDYVDRFQIQRLNPSGLGEWNKSQVKHGYTRSNASQNCVVLPAADGAWKNTLSWDTYCPPMKSATLAHNDGEHATAIYGGDGSDENPYLVATSSSIYVSATSESKLDDDNMTPYYQFKKAGSNDGEESSTATHTYTASGSNGTKEAMTVVARNYYYTTDAFYGTASPTSNSIYYESRTPYSVDVSGLTHMTVASGRTGSAAIVHGVEYVATLDSTVGYNRPTSVTVTCAGSDISAHCTWVKASGVLTIPAAYVTGNIAITAAGVAKTYTDDNNLDKNGGTSHGKYTATYEATSIDINTRPTYTGYTIDGYYGEAGLTTYIADAEGNLQASKNVGGYAVTDEAAQWKRDANITLYTKWTPNPYTLTLNDEFGTTPFYVAANGGVATIDVTFDSNTNLTSRITPPQREGYIFGGYYTAVDGGGTQIIDANGDVVADASDPSYTYTDASRNWKYAGNLIVYAKWTDDNIYVFYGMGRNGEGEFYNFGFWRYDDHWTKGKAPSDIDNHEVILIKQPEVDAPSTPLGQTYTACAKNIKIVTNGSYTCVDGTIIPASEYPKLSIDDNGAVVVKEYVRTYDMKEDKFGPTTSLNLHINAGTGRWGTAGSGGVLIMGDKIADNKAWVEFYTKAHKASHTDDETGETVNDYVNQYFGIPFDSTSVYDYEGVYLYAYKAETNSYEAAGNKPVDPFKAYLMLRTEPGPGTTLHMTGRLALPGTNLENTDRLKVLDLYSKADATASNMFANSWNGPLDIKAMTPTGDGADFVGVEPTFYLYNAGSKYDRDTAKNWIGNGRGQWTSLPVASVKADPASYPQSVIPPQQAFLLVAQSDDEAGKTHTLTLDYYKHVYKPAYDSVTAGKKIEIAPTRAPKHVSTDESLDIMRLIVVGQETSFSDRVIMYQRNDFSDGIDQGWEGRKIMGSSFAPQMFAISDDGKMSINAVKDVEGTVIGFRKGSEDAQYTISFEYRGENVWYLNDLKEEKSTLISDEDTYMFTSNDSDIETRFVISATPIHKTPTSVDNLNDGVKARKQMIDGTLYIIRDGRIYSTTGAMVK